MKRASGMPPLLLRFWLCMAALTTLSIIYTVAVAHRYHLEPPYGLPLLWGESRWGDLLIFQEPFTQFRTPQFWSAFADPFSYPAPLGVILGIIFKFAHPVRAYMAVLLTALAITSTLFVRILIRRGISSPVAWAFTLSTLAMTWPLAFLIDTSNLEGVVVILLGAGALAVLVQRYWLGAALIGIAGSMKVFPLVLLALLLSRRRYKEFAAGLAISAATTLLSLAVLGPSIAGAQHHLDVGFALARTRLFFSMSHLAPSFDHSLWMPVRFAVVYSDRWLHPSPAAMQEAQTQSLLMAALRIYLVLAASSGVALYFARIRRLPMLNQITALTVCAVMLPPLSLEYTLVHMLVPFALFCLYLIDTFRMRESPKGLALCVGSFVLIFNVNSFLDHAYVHASEARLVGLIVLLATVLVCPFAWIRGASLDAQDQCR